jgi:hypothetical protein
MKGQTMPEDMNFESLLAEFNQAYQEAEEFSDWMPPDDEYVVVVTKSNKDVTEKDDKKMGWWKLTAKILAPENPDLNGQEFCLGFYNTNALGILKGQVKALNSGVAVNSLAEANAIFTAAVGKALRVKVSTTTSRKNGQEYTNCYIQEVLPDIQIVDESQSAMPPQGDPTEAPQQITIDDDIPF